MSPRLRYPVLLFSLFASAAWAAPVVDKDWVFTTRDTLTLDVRLAAGAEPDWSKSTVELARDAANGSPQRLSIAGAGVKLDAATHVYRLVFDHIGAESWEPTAPRLYRVSADIATADGRHERIEHRVGFRSFTTEKGRLLLNGRPIFLRGFAINPPGRGIPDELERSRGFALDYVRYLLSLHVNIIRIPDDETWYSVCDELGMMVFGGNYSGRVNGRGPEADPAAAATWFREDKFHAISAHPSIVIYALTNEVPSGTGTGARWDAFLGRVYDNLHRWDGTRLYIANAGYGFGRVGEINDLHRYWGWYYETPFTFLHLRDYPELVFPEKTQPLTFTESVGNYNGPDGMVNLTPNHKNPPAQLNWTGHAPSSEQGALEFEHQSFTIRQATELFRRLRPLNGELSGVFPFTILFNHWHDITAFADMDPKPAAAQLRLSYQPVLLSWELYTPQVYAGATLKPILHVVNDADDGRDLEAATLTYELRDATQRAVAKGSVPLPAVAYFGSLRLPLTLQLSEALPTGNYEMWGTLTTAAGAVVSTNHVPLFVGGRGFAQAGETAPATVAVFDPGTASAHALGQLGMNVAATELSPDRPVPLGAPLVIGEDAVEKLTPATIAIVAEHVRQGGRVLVLRQRAGAAEAVSKLVGVALRMPGSDIDDPKYPPPPRPARNSFNVNPERPEHPVFAGIDRRQLRVWSDYTGWDEQKTGFPAIYPVSDGFVLTNKSDIASTAVLADYGPGLEGVAMAEFFAGRGSVLFCGFDLVRRVGLDPVADRLLRNLIAYVAQPDGHERYPLIDAPIVWGCYETERGVLTGINSGLMLNSRPVLTGSYRDMPVEVTKDGHEFAGGPGGWNSRPGIVYAPFGRRPFGPYVHRAWSGVPEPETPSAAVGEGRFWCRIPAGKTQVVHRVFNPAAAPLEVYCRANDREASARIPAGATVSVSVPLAAGNSTVESVIRGDRRLVLLETAFE